MFSRSLSDCGVSSANTAHTSLYSFWRSSSTGDVGRGPSPDEAGIGTPGDRLAANSRRYWVIYGIGDGFVDDCFLNAGVDSRESDWFDVVVVSKE